MAFNKSIFYFILLLGLVLRLYHLAYQSYWIDELVSVHFSSHSLWQALLWDNHFILYPLVLKGWINLWGDSELATRSLSVLFSMLSVVLAGHLFKKQMIKYIAILLMAINPLSILMAQETRPYALLEFLILLFLVFTIKNEEDPTRKSTIALLLAGIFAVMTHYLAIIPIFYLAAIWATKTQNLAKKIALLFLGSIFAMSVLQIINWSPLEWQRYKFAQGSATYDYFSIFLKLSSWAIFLYLPFLLIKKFRTSNFLTLIIHSFTPLLFAGLILTGYLFERNFALDRYFIIAVPFFVYSVSTIIEQLYLSEHRRYTIISLCFLTTISLCVSVNQIYQNVKAPWRELAQTFKNASPCPQIFTTRSLAINTPYFKKINCEVKKIDSIQQVITRVLETNQPVFIVDNYWGATPYLVTLKSELEEKFLANVDIQIFQKEKSDILYLVKISPVKTPLE